MRSTWRGITLRGRAVLFTGVAVALVALALGQRDLVRVAALLVALPLVAVLVLSRRDDRINIVRGLNPSLVPVGGAAVVQLQLQNVGNRASGPLLVTDAIDQSLGVEPRVVLEHVAPGEQVTTTYEVDARYRGRHRIGPLTLRIEDPFGMVQTSRTTETAHTLTVTPVVAPLRRGLLVRSTGGNGDGVSRRTAAAGHDDVGTREYRAGDELRRVHWRSTARTGELMVRQEEQSWEAQALVLVDTRRTAHNQLPTRSNADLHTSSFEWAVHAAASVGAQLAQSERRLRLVAGRADVSVTGGSTTSMLEALAMVRTDQEGVLVPTVARSTTAPVVIAVLGTLNSVDLSEIATLRAAATTGIALVLDTATWSGRPPVGGAGGGLGAPLSSAGWRVVVVTRGEDVADVWDRVLG